jgi:hypothetical protein
MNKNFEKEWINYYLKSLLEYKIEHGYFEFETQPTLTFKQLKDMVKDLPWYKFGNEEDRIEFIRYKYREYFMNNIWNEFLIKLKLN